jgi:tetratricopeptide (TPR) repeat protein
VKYRYSMTSAGLVGCMLSVLPLVLRAQNSVDVWAESDNSPLDVVAEQHYGRAVELATSGAAAPPEKEFRSAWERNPENFKYVQGLTAFYIHDHQYEKAIDVLRDHTTRHGATALGWTLQGELLFEQKNYPAAYECLRKALEVSQNNSRAHELIGLIFVVYQKDMEALEELKTAAAQNPSSPQIQFFLGRIYYKTGNYPQARDQFQACLRLQPGYPTALENLGLCYEALNDFGNAAQCYAQAVDLDKAGKNPASENPYIEYGLLLARQADAERAESMLRQGLARKPNSARANFELGRFLFGLEQYDEAERLLRRSADLDANFSRPHFFLAKLYQKRKRAAQANEEFALFEELDKVPVNRQPRITSR